MPNPKEPTRVAGALHVDFDAFVDAYRLPYLQFADAHLSDREAAGRVVENTFVQLAKVWQRISDDPGPEPAAWDMLQHFLTRELGRQQRGSSLIDSAVFNQYVLNTARRDFAVLESALGLYGAIASLPERQFQVIVVRYVLGYSVEDTARILGVTPQTIRSNVRHARTTLANLLGLAAPGTEKDQGKEVSP